MFGRSMNGLIWFPHVYDRLLRHPCREVGIANDCDSIPSQLLLVYPPPKLTWNPIKVLLETKGTFVPLYFVVCILFKFFPCECVGVYVRRHAGSAHPRRCHASSYNSNSEQHECFAGCGFVRVGFICGPPRRMYHHKKKQQHSLHSICGTATGPCHHL